MTLHQMIISTFGHVIPLSLHKFVYKLIFFHQTVAAAASRHFIKSLHLVRLNTRIPNKPAGFHARRDARFGAKALLVKKDIVLFHHSFYPSYTPRMTIPATTRAIMR